MSDTLRYAQSMYKYAYDIVNDKFDFDNYIYINRAIMYYNFTENRYDNSINKEDDRIIGNKINTDSEWVISKMEELLERLEQYKYIIFPDEVTQLIIAKYYGVISSNWNISDYFCSDTNTTKNDIIIGDDIAYNDHILNYSIGFKYDIENIINFNIFPEYLWKFKPQWKSIDPMEQLTNTFCPNEIEDLKEWYRKSEVYNEELKPGPKYPDLPFIE